MTRDEVEALFCARCEAAMGVTLMRSGGGGLLPHAAEVLRAGIDALSYEQYDELVDLCMIRRRVQEQAERRRLAQRGEDARAWSNAVSAGGLAAMKNVKAARRKLLAGGGAGTASDWLDAEWQTEGGDAQGGGRRDEGSGGEGDGGSGGDGESRQRGRLQLAPQTEVAAAGGQEAIAAHVGALRELVPRLGPRAVAAVARTAARVGEARSTIGGAAAEAAVVAVRHSWEALHTHAQARVALRSDGLSLCAVRRVRVPLDGADETEERAGVVLRGVGGVVLNAADAWSADVGSTISLGVRAGKERHGTLVGPAACIDTGCEACVNVAFKLRAALYGANVSVIALRPIAPGRPLLAQYSLADDGGQCPACGTPIASEWVGQRDRSAPLDDGARRWLIKGGRAYDVVPGGQEGVALSGWGNVQWAARAAVETGAEPPRLPEAVLPPPRLGQAATLGEGELQAAPPSNDGSGGHEGKRSGGLLLRETERLRREAARRAQREERENESAAAAVPPPPQTEQPPQPPPSPPSSPTVLPVAPSAPLSLLLPAPEDAPKRRWRCEHDSPPPWPEAMCYRCDPPDRCVRCPDCGVVFCMYCDG